MSRPNVLVIDAGLGNIGSVVAAFKRFDCAIERLSHPPSFEVTDTFTHAILPGVGAFSAGMNALRSLGWEDWIKNIWCLTDRPLLGICLGMQLLASEGFEGSLTGDGIAGLNLIPGRVECLTFPNLVFPHVGWNELNWQYRDHPIAKDISNYHDMYFVHSYAFRVFDPSCVLATSTYGECFASVVAKGACVGVQFHPEKSQKPGKKILANFLGLA